jgi:uncharacterized membrane protein YqjE
MAEPAARSQGLLTLMQRLLRTVFAIARNRLELALVELQEERTRVVETVLLVAVVVAFGSMTLAMISFTLAAIFWENHRVAVLVSLSLLYLGVTLVAYWRLRRRLDHGQAFSGTLAELKKDKACLDELR